MLVGVGIRRKYGMKMLTMTNLSTECLIQLTKLGYDATPFNQILKQNAKREMRLRLGKVTVADVLAAQPVTTNLLKFMRASIKMIGVSNLQSFIASMTQKLTFFFQAEDGIRDTSVTGVQTCALPISRSRVAATCSLASVRRCTGATAVRATIRPSTTASPTPPSATSARINRRRRRVRSTSASERPSISALPAGARVTNTRTC